MFQEIAIILIGILTAGYVVWKLCRRVTSSAADSPCAGCGKCCRPDTPEETCLPADKKKQTEKSKEER